MSFYMKDDKSKKTVKRNTPTKKGIKILEKMTRKEVQRLLSDVALSDSLELEYLSLDENAPALKRLAAQVMLRAIKTGDVNRADWILDRTIGKVKEEVQLDVVVPTVIKRFGKEDSVELGLEKPDIIEAQQVSEDSGQDDSET